MMKRFCLLSLCSLLLGTACQQQPQTTDTNLQQELDTYLDSQQATVGVSVLTDSATVVSRNDSLELPLLSMFKFPVALAVLHRMEQQGTPLDTVFSLTPDDLKTDTYSPLRERFPERRAEVRMDSLLAYSVSLSDNNACDVLLRYAGGPQAVEQYVHSLGITDMHISASEDDMHQQPERQRDNRATPTAVSQLFRLFLQKGLVSPSYRDYLYQILTQTSTGMNKLKAGLPDSITLGHKTGSSDRTPEGVRIADNDAGFVVLPDGRRYYITVLVNNSMENDSTNAAISATVSRMVYRHLTAQPTK